MITLSYTSQIIADSLGWIGNIAFILGAIYIAKKSIRGFWYQIAANLLYFGQSLILKISSLLVISLILTVINIIGVYKWNCLSKKEDKKITSDKHKFKKGV